MREIRIHRREVGVFRLHPQKRFAHMHQCRDALRREIEAADEFLPTRLRRGAQLQERRGRRLGTIGLDGLVQPLGVRPETFQKHCHEGLLPLGIQPFPPFCDLLGKRHAGRLAPA